MKKESVWIATVPTDSTGAEPTEAYQQHEAAGEILHVLSDPEVTTVVTRTQQAADTALAMGNDRFMGPVCGGIEPAYLWTIEQDGDGTLNEEDRIEMDALGSKMHLIFVTPTSAVSVLHPDADVSVTHT